MLIGHHTTAHRSLQLSTALFLDYSATETAADSPTASTTCLGQALTEEQVWARGGENENAVGNLVLHLAGNVRQWIVSGVGGTPDIRQRDLEFSAREALPRDTA